MRKVAEFEVNGLALDLAEDLGGGKESTGKKFYNEISKRLEMLTPRQKAILVEGDIITRRQIAFLSMCKRHHFIRDFVVEVLREKYLVYDYQLTAGEYTSFFRRKVELHPDMYKLKESSIKKIQQVTLKILEQAGLIDDIKKGNIEPQILDDKVVEAITEDDPELLKIFLMSDVDIEEMT